MDSNTGKLYSTLDEAKAAGVKDPVLIEGSMASIRRVSNAVARDHRRKVKAARKANRARRG